MFTIEGFVEYVSEEKSDKNGELYRFLNIGGLSGFWREKEVPKVGDLVRSTGNANYNRDTKSNFIQFRGCEAV